MSSQAITLDPVLLTRLDEASRQANVQLGELVNQAVGRYLDELDRHKIDNESRAFRAMHHELVRHYAGEYVAVHDGDVVDHDLDASRLYIRIRERYGRTAVLIRQITEEPEIELHFHSPSQLETAVS